MLVKVLRDDMTHFGFKYTFGLNILKEPLNTDKTIPVGPGGLYYCDIMNLDSHVYRGDFLCVVEVPQEAIVVPLQFRGPYYRTNQLILTSEIYRFDNKDDVKKLILLNPQLSDYLNDP